MLFTEICLTIWPHPFLTLGQFHNALTFGIILFLWWQLSLILFFVFLDQHSLEHFVTFELAPVRILRVLGLQYILIDFGQHKVLLAAVEAVKDRQNITFPDFLDFDSLRFRYFNHWLPWVLIFLMHFGWRPFLILVLLSWFNFILLHILKFLHAYKLWLTGYADTSRLITNMQSILIDKMGLKYIFASSFGDVDCVPLWWGLQLVMFGGNLKEG